MKWPWPLPTVKDILGFAFVAAIVIFVAFVTVRYPTLHETRNEGFGPDWDCTRTGSGEPVCVKKIPAAK